MAEKGGLSAPQHHIPPPKTQGAATGGQQLSATATQFVDKIDPFSKRYERVLTASWYLGFATKSV